MRGALPRLLLLGVWAAVVLLAEARWPLRRATEPKGRRALRNLAVAATSALVAQGVERPVVAPLARRVVERRWGLVQRLPLPAPVRAAVALLLLDGSFYAWHVLTHRVPALWRLHVVHHADQDMDASTALRFHGAEIGASIPWRAAQVVLIGVGPRTLALWQGLVLASILFHHADLRLPPRLERRLAWWVVTPRLHGIHHSVVREETDSNWSSGLTLWDRLFGTFRDDVPDEEIVIGVPGLRGAARVGLPALLRAPFVAQPPSWRWPDGSRPVRGPDGALRREEAPPGAAHRAENTSV